MTKRNPNQAVHNPNKAEHQPKLRARDILTNPYAVMPLMGFIAMGAIVAGGIKEKSAETGRQAGLSEQIERDAIGEVLVPQEMIMIRGGANYRHAPRFAEPKMDIHNHTTLEDKIDKGKAIVVNQPLKYTDEDGEDWYGFHFVDDETTGTTLSISDINWVNASRLLEQRNQDDNPYIARYSKTGQAETSYTATEITATGDSFTLTSASGSEDGTIAAAKLIDEDSAEAMLEMTYTPIPDYGVTLPE